MAKKQNQPSKPAAAGIPMVDTNLAAEAAARMLAARKAGLAGPAAHSNQTSTFKQLKESLAKPHSQTMSNVLDKNATDDQKKTSNLAGLKHQQIGHNQTVGGNVSRVSVPRRTAG